LAFSFPFMKRLSRLSLLAPFALLALGCFSTMAFGQTQPAATASVSPEEALAFPLWPVGTAEAPGAPGALGIDPRKDIPTLTPFLPEPEKATGAAILICPGGAYFGLAGHEGAGYAKWFAQQGIAAFVLKYRLASAGYHHPVMLGDASRALRTIRADAAKWGLDPKRIGIIGSSAGGHLASTLLTHYDAGDPLSNDPVERTGSRPDFGILCYAVITLGPFTHEGTRTALLGPRASQALQDYLSNEKQVTADTPPTFIWHTVTDDAVPVKNALLFAGALQEHGVAFDLHLYQSGRHGIGLGKAPEYHPWVHDCLHWMKERGLLTRPGEAKEAPANPPTAR
jgi:acetyl esterase/lipase